MKTPITYYGGKQRLTKAILAMIPPHKIYIEPFFGGGAVFFAKEPSYLEVINDINDNIITFYRVCQDDQAFHDLQAGSRAHCFPKPCSYTPRRYGTATGRHLTWRELGQSGCAATIRSTLRRMEDGNGTWVLQAVTPEE